MQRRVLLAFIVLNIIVSIVVTFTVATLISQGRPEPTPLNLTPIVIVATPTGPTQTPIEVPVTVVITADPDAPPPLNPTEIILTALAASGEEAPASGETASDDATEEEPEASPTPSNPQLTQTAAAEDDIQTHEVQQGEFPGLIAEQYDVSVEDLLCQNNLDPVNPLIYPGDVLIIPGPEGCDVAIATETPAPTETAAVTATEESSPTPTLLPTITLPATAESAQVRIMNVLSPGDITDEEIVLVNEGGLVSLEAWVIYDKDGNEFTFPNRRLFPGGSVSLRSRTGEDTPIVLYWGLNTAVWGEEDDVVTLVDDEGNVQSIYVLGEPDGVPPTPEPSPSPEASDEDDESDEDETSEETETPLG